MAVRIELSALDAQHVIDSLDSCKADFESIEEVEDWYTPGPTIDRIESSLEILNSAMIRAKETE